jgi:hypothetical protein
MKLRKKLGKLARFFFLLLFFSLSCGYVFHSVLPAHIKNVKVTPFLNRTSQYGLDNLLTEEIVENITYSPQLKISEEKADAVLSGEIILYQKEELAFEEKTVKEYKIRIRANVQFKDLVKDKVLWEEKNMEGVAIYLPQLEEETASYHSLTEEEAIKKAVSSLAREIVNRTTTGW